MHPQVIRDTPGDCPICGMFLIEKIEQDKNSFDSSLTDIVGSVNKSVLVFGNDSHTGTDLPASGNRSNRNHKL